MADLTNSPTSTPEQCKGKAAQPIQDVLTPRTSSSRTLARNAVLSTIVGLGLSAAATLQAAGGDRTTPTPAPKQSQTKPHQWYQVGKASWYGGHFQGRKTANGERFDMHELTCAHRTLPLGSWVRITNVHNHKRVFVRVNDRGPMIDDRIVDLSYAAARAVGISGLGRVRIEIVRPDDQEMAKELTAQLKMPSPLIASGR